MIIQVKVRFIHSYSPYLFKVQRVAYLNTREFPVPGRRIARLETQLECENHKTIHLEVINISQT